MINLMKNNRTYTKDSEDLNGNYVNIAEDESNKFQQFNIHDQIHCLKTSIEVIKKAKLKKLQIQEIIAKISDVNTSDNSQLEVTDNLLNCSPQEFDLKFLQYILTNMNLSVQGQLLSTRDMYDNIINEETNSILTTIEQL